MKGKRMKLEEKEIVHNKLRFALDELLAHHSYGEIKIDLRWSKAGVKEIVLTVAKQYRYLVSTENKKV